MSAPTRELLGRRLRLNGHGQRQAFVLGHPADLQVVSVWRTRVIALERRIVDIVGNHLAVGSQMRTRGINGHAEFTLLEVGPDAIYIPRRDSKRNVIDSGSAPAAFGICTTAAAAASAKVRVVRVTAADNGITDIADHEFILASFVVGFFPAQQVRVIRDTLLVVTHSEREMIQPNRFPIRRLERQGLRQFRSWSRLAGCGD